MGKKKIFELQSVRYVYDHLPIALLFNLLFSDCNFKTNNFANFYFEEFSEHYRSCLSLTQDNLLSKCLIIPDP